MIETDRLILRAFIEADRDPWAEMNICCRTLLLLKR